MEPMQLNELEEVSSLYQEMEDEKTEHTIEELRVILAEKSERLMALEEEIFELETKAKKLDEEHHAILKEIQQAWAPFIKGADKAKMAFDNGLVLEATNKISISKEDEETATKWLLENGYESAMKWQIHHMTMVSIANKRLEAGEKIPGLSYTPFTVVKVKEKKTK